MPTLSFKFTLLIVLEANELMTGLYGSTVHGSAYVPFPSTIEEFRPFRYRTNESKNIVCCVITQEVRLLTNSFL